MSTKMGLSLLERFHFIFGVLGAMPTLAVGMFFRENCYMATKSGHGTRHTHDGTALGRSKDEKSQFANRASSSVRVYFFFFSAFKHSWGVITPSLFKSYWENSCALDSDESP